MTNWEAAQPVQRSAFADGSNYRANNACAIEIRKSPWESTDAAPDRPGDKIVHP